MSFPTDPFIHKDSDFWFFQPDPSRIAVVQPADVRRFETEMYQDDPTPALSFVDTKASDVAQSIMPAAAKKRRRSPEERVKIRREQSRACSQLYRQRQRAKVAQLDDDNTALASEVNRLREENAFLKHQLIQRILLAQSTTEMA